MQWFCGNACLVLFVFSVGGFCADVQRPAELSPKPSHRAGTEIETSIGMKLVHIQPGRFVMGSPQGEKGRFEDEEQHEVEITKGFYLGKFEVTQEEYQKVIEKNPSAFKGPRLPVETVSWKEAKEFCRVLSVKEGKGDKDGKGKGAYRLPTEAEWELACRAGTKSAYHFGESISLEKANYYNPKKNGPVAVGSYATNNWGLHDMHGNVWEWCEDFYTADYVKDVAKIDPNGPLKGNHFRRIIRGGGWGNAPDYCRSATRNSQERTIGGNIGFRVARTAED